MCPPGPVAGGGPGDSSGAPAPSVTGPEVLACAASLTGSGARTEWGRADRKCTAAKTAAAIRTTASAARVLGSKPHLSCSHTGIRSRSAGTSLSRHPGTLATCAGAEGEVEVGVEAGSGALSGAGLGIEGGLGAETGVGAEATPSTGRATRPPYAPPMRASARRREAAATTSARPRDDRRRPGPRPGPPRARPSEAGVRPGPLPLVARCDRGAMPHDGRHIRPNPLSRPNLGGKTTSCG